MQRVGLICGWGKVGAEAIRLWFWVLQTVKIIESERNTLQTVQSSGPLLRSPCAFTRLRGILKCIGLELGNSMKV